MNASSERWHTCIVHASKHIWNNTSAAHLGLCRLIITVECTFLKLKISLYIVEFRCSAFYIHLHHFSIYTCLVACLVANLSRFSKSKFVENTEYFPKTEVNTYHHALINLIYWTLILYISKLDNACSARCVASTLKYLKVFNVPIYEILDKIEIEKYNEAITEFIKK